MKLHTSSPRATILSALDKYLAVVSPTYGPAGKGVLISNEYSVRSVDDGKLASQEFELESEIENAVIQYIREATEKTDKRVGDGTTTAALIMGALVKETFGDSESFLPKEDVYKTTVSLRKAVKEAVETIRKQAKKIKSKDELYKVVLNSYNNPEIAKIISETLFEIGKDGVLTAEDSKGMTTESEFVEGLEIDKGYASPYFLNRENHVYLENPVIAVFNKKLQLVQEIIPLLEKCLKEGRKDIVLIAEDFDEQVISAFIVNKLRNLINPVLIKSPGYGESRTELLKDIAAVVGTQVIDPATGAKIEDIEVSQLGSCEVIKSYKDETIFIKGKGKNLKSYIESVKSNVPDNDYEKERHAKRVAKLSGGVAVIKIGAPTENEQKTIKAKVEDAIHAAKAAFSGGVVLGGGVSLAQIKTSSEILNKAIKEPRKQLELNGVDALDENVHDPAEVQIAAIESAVSIAIGLINIGSIIATKREKKDKIEY